MDEYGNVLQSAAIGYGRRFKDPSLTNDDQEKQAGVLATWTENTYTKPAPGRIIIVHPCVCEARTYEMINLTYRHPIRCCRTVTNLFWFGEIVSQDQDAGDGGHDVPYEEVNHTQARTSASTPAGLIEHVRTLYRKNNLTGFSPLGTVESLALPGESYKLAFTPDLLKTIYVDTGR